MAVLSATELKKIRNGCETGLGSVNYTKTQINAAIQALEDWYEANKASGVTAMNNATAPFTFTAAQKKQIGAYWFQYKFAKELSS